MDRNGNGGSLSQKSRAEMFEDEKRRIIDSCFNKREPDGSCTSVLESPLPAFVALQSLQSLPFVVAELTDLLFRPISTRNIHNSHPHH